MSDLVQTNSNMKNILNNNNNKLIFLKAILLGISYGKSKNADTYSINIANEINKINLSEQTVHSVTNIEENSNLSTHKYSDKELISETNVNENINTDSDINTDKHEKILYNLENTKNIILYNINKFSNNNSNILYLHNNLNIINQEIIKNKLIINKYKKTKKSEYVNELEKTLDNLSNLFI